MLIKFYFSFKFCLLLLSTIKPTTFATTFFVCKFLPYVHCRWRYLFVVISRKLQPVYWKKLVLAAIAAAALIYISQLLKLPNESYGNLL